MEIFLSQNYFDWHAEKFFFSTSSLGFVVQAPQKLSIAASVTAFMRILKMFAPRVFIFGIMTGLILLFILILQTLRFFFTPIHSLIQSLASIKAKESGKPAIIVE